MFSFSSSSKHLLWDSFSFLLCFFFLHPECSGTCNESWLISKCSVIAFAGSILSAFCEQPAAASVSGTSGSDVLGNGATMYYIKLIRVRRHKTFLSLRMFSSLRIFSTPQFSDSAAAIKKLSKIKILKFCFILKYLSLQKSRLKNILKQTKWLPLSDVGVAEDKTQFH